MSPYNILSDIKSGRIQVKSMDSATILFFKCRRRDYIIGCPLCQCLFKLFVNNFWGNYPQFCGVVLILSTGIFLLPHTSPPQLK